MKVYFPTFSEFARIGLELAAYCPTSQMAMTSQSQEERLRYKLLGVESLREL